MVLEPFSPSRSRDRVRYVPNEFTIKSSLENEMRDRDSSLCRADVAYELRCPAKRYESRASPCGRSRGRPNGQWFGQSERNLQGLLVQAWRASRSGGRHLGGHCRHILLQCAPLSWRYLQSKRQGGSIRIWRAAAVRQRHLHVLVHCLCQPSQYVGSLVPGRRGLAMR